MASIIFQVPNEFQHVKYINATIYLAKLFEDKFKNVQLLKVKIEVLKSDGNMTEQQSFSFGRESIDEGFVIISFVQYITGNKITELLDVDSFTADIKSILLKASLEL